MSDSTNDQDQQRLDELEEEISTVRREAEEHGTLPPEQPPRTFEDPDGDGTVDPTEAQPPG